MTLSIHFNEPAAASVLISSILYNPGLTNEAYIRHRIALAKADTTRSKGERHREIQSWCDTLDIYKAEAEKWGEVQQEDE